MRTFRLFILAASLLLAAPCAWAQSTKIRPLDPMIDQPMLLDPLLEDPARIDLFHPRLVEVWLQCLARPDADTRRRAADAIALAQEENAPGLLATAPQLLDELTRANQHRVVRLSAAKALIALDYKQAAAGLLERSTRDGLEMVLIADPALARWDHQPARELWLQRLSDEHTQSIERSSAIESLATVREARAIEPLRAILRNRDSGSSLRMVVARALGAIATQGLESDARQLAQGDVVDRILATRVLNSHTSESAVRVLLQLAGDREPAVAAAAIERTLQIDPLLLTPTTAQLITNADPNVRQLTIESLLAQASVPAVGQLGPVLDDVNPDVRTRARDVMIELAAQADLRDAICAQATAMLNQASWRGLEQAALVVGRIDHEPAGERLLELLTHDRPEVRVASAAALRWQAVPEMLPSIYERVQTIAENYKTIAQERTARIEKGETLPLDMDLTNLTFAIDREVAQLFQLFGVMRYKPAEPYLRKFIPKRSGYGVDARAAAVWALGLLYEDQADNDLPGLFASRLSDINPMEPEAQPVRQMSAISLGRMKASAGMSALQRFYKEENGIKEIGGACRWAIMQITGQTLPPLEPVEVQHTGWFIEPTDKFR